MQLADQRHGHAVEAVACAEAVDQPELGAQQLRAAAQSGDRAGDDEAGEDVALDGDAVEAAGGHVVAHGPQLEAAAGPEQHVIHEQAHRDSQHEAPGEAHTGHHAWQLHQLGDGRSLWDVLISDPAGIEHAHKQCGHVVEHDGDDHLVLAAGDLQHTGDHAPDAAGQRTGQQRQQDAGKPGQATEVGRQERGDGAHQELALAAQIEHAALIGKAGAQRGEHQRSGLIQRGTDVGAGAEGALEQILHRLEGIGAQRRHDDAADQEGQQDRQQRHREAAQRAFELFHIHSPLTYRSWQD